MKLARTILIAVAVLAAPATLFAQPAPQYVISTYRAAPGQQVELVRWLAQQDRIAEAAGTPRMQFYVHTNGANWDYLVVQPVTTPEQDRAFEAAAARMGVPQGPRVGLDLRRHLVAHEDTFVVATTPAEYLAAVGER